MAARGKSLMSASKHGDCYLGRDHWPLFSMQTLSGEAHLRDLCPPSTTAIIITPPSSPDESTKAPQKIHKTPPPQPYQSWPLSDRSFSAPFDSPHLSPTPTARSEPPRMSPFQERLAALDLPPPGADHFAARRTLWLSPGPNPPCATEANPSRQRLEALLAPPGAVEDDDVWKTGVDRVWRGLVAGARLKHRLPLALVVRSPLGYRPF